MTVCDGMTARAVCYHCRAEGPAVPAEEWRRARIVAVAKGWRLIVRTHRRYTHFRCPECVAAMDGAA